MQRIHWTLDLQEAHIVAGLLRAEEIDAFVFDESIVRMDWTAALAYGGYRIVVPADQATPARDLLMAWRRGEYALPDDDAMHCPRCAGTDVHPDQRRRGWTFVVFVLLSLPIPWPWQRRIHCHTCGKRWNRAPGEFVRNEHSC